MSYTIRPNVGDTLANTRDPIRTNFTVLQDRFNENHVLLDGGSGGGKHKFLQMPEQSTSPSTAVNEGALFTDVGTSPAETNLFFRAEDSGGGGGFEYQMTKVNNSQTARFANTSFASGNTTGSGWTFLPGGLILFYGTTIDVAQGDQAVVFPFSFPTAAFVVTATLRRTTGGEIAVAVNSLTTSGFNMRHNSSGSHSCYWMAIGN